MKAREENKVSTSVGIEVEREENKDEKRQPTHFVKHLMLVVMRLQFPNVGYSILHKGLSTQH